ncbi:unnamed protein product [Didymodactylos carnosus]|uniref:Uncharacterized protein n=1 Tax=Didymodactylos carnosus TaxID=1234261 RepID=A0A813U3R6_9BILA|nr:unnamed protein product [Didymodactylos carnosus]CAF0866618.1 unnamed protein product [Didymodactylos carnosus]CAF3608804.1 unnamed protein product [Didymodactylos carnosus]CAF3651430.1 unnamed protein product [Didymodactylos carnosus]
MDVTLSSKLGENDKRVRKISTSGYMILRETEGMKPVVSVITTSAPVINSNVSKCDSESSNFELQVDDDEDEFTNDDIINGEWCRWTVSEIVQLICAGLLACLVGMFLFSLFYKFTENVISVNRNQTWWYNYTENETLMDEQNES